MTSKFTRSHNSNNTTTTPNFANIPSELNAQQRTLLDDADNKRMNQKQNVNRNNKIQIQVDSIVKNSVSLFDNVCTSPILNRNDMENDNSFAKLFVNSPKKARATENVSHCPNNLDDSIDSLVNFVEDYTCTLESDPANNGGGPVIFSVASPIGIDDSTNSSNNSYENKEHGDSQSNLGVNTPDESTNSNESESEDQRMARELAESEVLARRLMAEEAMASYTMSQDFLSANADQFSNEDLAALQAAMEEEDPNASVDEDVEDDSQELSYDTLLRLGERIGDVKSERWAMRSHKEIAKLPTFIYEGSDKIKEHNDSTSKCLICQEKYDQSDNLRVLPCKHCFHIECVDQWLATKDCCPYCRQEIASD